MRTPMIKIKSSTKTSLIVFGAIIAFLYIFLPFFNKSLYIVNIKYLIISIS